jgi:catechol 2,3-dioxygenase-like lactoylglutathione lyase family enzyme
MIDHTGVSVADVAKSKAFYTRALAPLGYTLIMEFEKFAGFGEGAANGPSIHVAFRARTRAAVDAFYKAAITAGGRDNGAPGLRPHYHENYYGAFVLDPDGHNVEAVCHDPA